LVRRLTRPAPGTSGPLLPGDPEREYERGRRQDGVPLDAAVVEDLRDISKRTGIPLE
jgi:LDH2 family malate/lactate/ureidoglycolate dehydrogenase